MNDFPRKTVGFALVLSILISSYMMIVQIVNAFEPEVLLESLSLKSLRSLNATDKLVMGDTLIVEAFSEWANAYTLEIYHESSLIFEEDESFNGSMMEIFVPLLPPTFSAGNGYAVIFYAHVYNKPVLGAYFSDCMASMFETVSIEAKLELDATYDGLWRSLSLCVNLTDSSGYLIVNETVDFSVQFGGKRRPTDGWVPIGFAKTNASGVAFLSLAFSVLMEPIL